MWALLPVLKLWLTEKVRADIAKRNKEIEVLDKTVRVLEKIEDQAAESLRLGRDTNGVVKDIKDDTGKIRRDLT